MDLPRPDVLMTAHNLIRGERARHYGPPHRNFEVISQLWTVYVLSAVEETLRNQGVDPDEIIWGRLIDPNDVCNLMSLLKLAREATGNGYHEDSTVDVVGYQAIKQVMQTPIEQFLEEMQRSEPQAAEALRNG